MKHSRRTRLKVEDLDNALKVKNIEPLWGFSSTSHVPFKKTITSTGTIYHLDDEEIDLSKVLKLELPSVPRDVSFTGKYCFFVVFILFRGMNYSQFLRSINSSLVSHRRNSTTNKGESNTSR